MTCWIFLYLILSQCARLSDHVQVDQLLHRLPCHLVNHQYPKKNRTQTLFNSILPQHYIDQRINLALTAAPGSPGGPGSPGNPTGPCRQIETMRRLCMTQVFDIMSTTALATGSLTEKYDTSLTVLIMQQWRLHASVCEWNQHTGLPLGPSSPEGPRPPAGPAAPGGPVSPFSPVSPLRPWGKTHQRRVTMKTT